jgi:hypothetical protein
VVQLEIKEQELSGALIFKLTRLLKTALRPTPDTNPGISDVL